MRQAMARPVRPGSLGPAVAPGGHQIPLGKPRDRVVGLNVLAGVGFRQFGVHRLNVSQHGLGFALQLRGRQALDGFLQILHRFARRGQRRRIHR